MSNKMKQEYTFLIEFKVRKKKDCEKLLKMVKQNRTLIKNKIYMEK